jgi:DNA polymerase-3 subunit delta'
VNSAALDAALEALPGIDAHPHARAVLGPALPPEGHPSHAYLFQGPGGSGKRTVARAFAAALLSDGAANPAEAAGRVQRGTHPDLSWVRPSGAAEMLVSDIGEAVVAGVNRTPFEAHRRVFVIERADTMNDQAANRMLKTLEEPPSFAHLVLLTDRPGDLLATIVSRCQPVRFDSPSSDQLAQRLQAQGVELERARACARLSLGDGERALRLAVGEGPAMRAGAESFARAALRGAVSEGPWRALLARAGEHGDRALSELEGALAGELELLAKSERRRHERETSERARRAQRRASAQALDEALALVGLWYRDVACVVDGAPEAALAVDRLDALVEDAAGADSHRLRAAQEHVDDTRQRLLLNVSAELACEALAYRLARELT